MEKHKEHKALEKSGETQSLEFSEPAKNYEELFRLSECHKYRRRNVGFCIRNKIMLISMEAYPIPNAFRSKAKSTYF